MRRAIVEATLLVLGVATATGCVTHPYDYGAYRQHMPRSILVLPPLNESVEVGASYSYLATVSRPLGEAGYYVFPVAVIDQMLKDNGLPTPGEMHTASLAKLREIIGADSVLYITIENWGQKYRVITSSTVVKLRAKLVHLETGATLWDGSVELAENSGGGGDPIAALVVAVVAQVIESSIDMSHHLARRANAEMFFDKDNGLLFGPRSPSYEADLRGR